MPITFNILGEFTTLRFHCLSFKILEMNCHSQACCWFGKRTERVSIINQLWTCVLCLELPWAFPFPGQVLLPTSLLLSWMEGLSTGIQDARNHEIILEGSVSHCSLWVWLLLACKAPRSFESLQIPLFSMSSGDLRQMTLYTVNTVMSSIQASCICHTPSSQPLYAAAWLHHGVLMG